VVCAGLMNCGSLRPPVLNTAPMSKKAAPDNLRVSGARYSALAISLLLTSGQKDALDRFWQVFEPIHIGALAP
jgi:hypothetical protein